MLGNVALAGFRSVSVETYLALVVIAVRPTIRHFVLGALVWREGQGRGNRAASNPHVRNQAAVDALHRAQ